MRSAFFLQGLKRIHTYSASEWQLALEALATVTVVRMVLVLLPFPDAMAGLGLHRGALCEVENNPVMSSQIAAVSKAISRASKVAPLKAVCLQQAVTAAMMLRRRKIAVEVHFGVGKDIQGGMIAHAWSISSGTVITGQRGICDVVPISVFVT